MSGSHDLERRLADHYAREAPHRAPDRVLASTLETIETTPQRRAWWPARRMPEMSNALKLALGAAAVVVASLVGFSVLGGGSIPGVGGPAASPSPTPSPSPSPSPSPYPPPLPASADLEAGTYAVEVGPWHIELTVPAGFTSYLREPVIYHETADPPDGHGILFFETDAVASDPCRSNTTMDPVGPSVNDVVSAVAAREGGLVGEIDDIELSGFVGKKVTIAVPEDVAFEPPVAEGGGHFPDCDSGQYRTARTLDGGYRYHQGPGQVDELWVIGDETGTKRLIIDVAYFPGTSADHLAELQAIVDSLVITLE